MNRNRVALITGANKGLGLEIARQLGKQDITVVLAARTLEKAAEAAGKLKAESIDAHPVELEVTDSSHIAALPAFFESHFGRLDILVNNAGVFLDEPGKPVSVDSLRATYETNVLGPYAITQALLPLLKASPAGRIVNQSSILGSITEIGAGHGGSFTLPGYCSSKSALNMLTVVQAQHLQGSNVKVNSAHPGWVQTDMGGANATLKVEEGAKTAVALATLPADGPSGTFQHLGKTLPW